MSLVGTYVQSKEGHWYDATPVIRHDDWFVCWDDADPIELVVKEHVDPSTVIRQLNADGWCVRVRSKGYKSGRLFDGKFHQANSVFLTQECGPPDELMKGNKRLVEQPHNQGVYYFNGHNGHS